MNQSKLENLNKFYLGIQIFWVLASFLPNFTDNPLTFYVGLISVIYAGLMYCFIIPYYKTKYPTEEIPMMTTEEYLEQKRR